MSYPSSLDSLATNKADATTMASDHAAHHNSLATAVNAIETELGLNPAKTFVRKSVSYVIYKSGSTFQADSPIGLTAVGANADAGAVLQSCLDNINSTTTPRGTILFAPNTVFTWSSTPTIRRTYASAGSDDKLWLRILGTGGSVIQSAAGGESFIRVNRQADYDGFCGIEIGDLQIDAANRTGNTHVVFGNRTSGSNVVQRCDYRRIWLHDIETINVPTSTTLAYARPNVWMQISHLGASEATQNVCEDVTIERCRFNGGYSGFNIGHLGATAGLNVKNDRITVRNVYWDSGISASWTGFQAGGNQLGGNAFGGSVLVEGCTFIGSSDVGIELDNFKHNTVRRLVTRDCLTSGLYVDNFNYVNGVDATEQPEQHFLFEDCAHEQTLDLFASAGLRNGFFQLGATGGTIDFGTFVFRNCRLLPKVAQTWIGGIWGRLTPASGRSVHKVVFEGCSWGSFYNNAAAGTIDPKPWDIEQAPKTLVIRDQRLIWRGAKSAAGDIIMRGLMLNGGDKDTCSFEIDGLEITDLTTGRGAFATEAVRLGNTVPAGAAINNLRGIIRRLRYAVLGATSPVGVFVTNTTTLTLNRLDFEDSDFSNLGSLDAEVKFQTATQNEGSVFLRGINPRVPPRAELTFTPGSTTVAAQYLGHYEGLLTVTGGTVTLVEVSTDNATFRTVAAGTNVGFYVDHGWYIRLTYTVSPTCKVIPRR